MAMSAHHGEMYAGRPLAVRIGVRSALYTSLIASPPISAITVPSG
jgi:hypothetical protein